MIFGYTHNSLVIPLVQTIPLALSELYTKNRILPSLTFLTSMAQPLLQEIIQLLTQGVSQITFGLLYLQVIVVNMPLWLVTNGHQPLDPAQSQIKADKEIIS